MGFDVASPNIEQTQVALITEGNELTKVQRIGIAGETPVAAEEPVEGYVFGTGNLWVLDDDGCRCGGHGIPPGSAGLGGTRRPGPRWMRSPP